MQLRKASTSWKKSRLSSNRASPIRPSTSSRNVNRLEGGIAASWTSSGSSAILTLTSSLCRTGDKVVLPYKLYGGTNHAFKNWYPRLGIKGGIHQILES
ncbi:BQ5605_C002g01324 [Microbotryum silenes-dioicae]|uniref:BQ5605_C002g01324 protein n=1 Tax=Microbotryum silenes-dioicae TaxID=796604 RepID=A0A2X0NW17_9BASI|nr:BQ5605_C002g01324 [Microbotryum silenes-dioicae]